LALPLLSVAQRLGATEVLQKPFLPGELLEAIKRVLQSKRRRTAKKRRTSLSDVALDGR